MGEKMKFVRWVTPNPMFITAKMCYAGMVIMSTFSNLNVHAQSYMEYRNKKKIPYSQTDQLDRQTDRITQYTDSQINRNNDGQINEITKKQTVVLTI